MMQYMCFIILINCNNRNPAIHKISHETANYTYLDSTLLIIIISFML